MLILGDGVLGTIMEPVVLPPMRSEEEVRRLKDELRDWALVGHDPEKEERAFILPGGWSTKRQEQTCISNAALYDSWVKDVQVETIGLEDAEVVVTGYGISGRIARSAVNKLRAEGARVGYIRPKTVSPFPYETFEKLDYSRVKAILDVEMSIPALMKLDVELAVKDRTRIETCLHAGGEIMSSREVEAAIRALLQGGRTE